MYLISSPLPWMTLIVVSASRAGLASVPETSFASIVLKTIEAAELGGHSIGTLWITLWISENHRVAPGTERLQFAIASFLGGEGNVLFDEPGRTTFSRDAIR